MSEKHLDQDTLVALAEQRGGDLALAAASDHLWSCAVCRDRLVRLAPDGTGALKRVLTGEASTQSSVAYRPLFERLQVNLRRQVGEIGDEIEAAKGVLEQLLAQEPGQQILSIRTDEAYRSRVLAQLLLDRGRQRWVASPAEAELYADLALEVIEQLEGAGAPRAAVNDLRALRWIYLGNVRRIQSDFRCSEDAFTLAESFLELGSSDPLVRAELFDLKASLRRDQARLGESRGLLNRARAIYHRLGDEHRVGRVMIKTATVASEAGDPDQAIELLQRANLLIDTDREPRLRHIVFNELVLYLRQAGRPQEAVALLPQARDAAERFGAPLDRLRLAWGEGLLAVDLGNLGEAERTLIEVRRGFIAEGIGYDAALASLDLAHLYLSQGRTAETCRLAAEMLPIFQSRDIDREALAALMVFYRAAELDKVTTTIVDEVAACVKRSRPAPSLRAEKPS